MSGAGALRVALLEPAGGEGRVDELADALAASGQEPVVVRARTVAMAEALLRRRGFTASLSAVPPSLADLMRGGFELAHAFDVPGALAAHAWRRRARRPVVFTCSETLDRSNVADARLRLSGLSGALERSDAVLASSDAVRAALVRWMALDAPVVDGADAGAHVEVYTGLLTGPR